MLSSAKWLVLSVQMIGHVLSNRDDRYWIVGVKATPKLPASWAQTLVQELQTRAWREQGRRQQGKIN